MKKLRWIYRKIHKETFFWSQPCLYVFSLQAVGHWCRQSSCPPASFAMLSGASYVPVCWVRKAFGELAWLEQWPLGCPFDQTNERRGKTVKKCRNRGILVRIQTMAAMHWLEWFDLRCHNKSCLETQHSEVFFRTTAGESAGGLQGKWTDERFAIDETVLSRSFRLMRTFMVALACSLSEHS